VGNEVHSSVAVIDNGKFGKREIRFETGRLAAQASGSTVVYLDEDTMLLSATTASKSPRESFDFFPLTVDVEERMYAAGRIPGSFFRREGRPSEDAILTCRLIDRPLRPSFVKGLRNEVQVVVTVMALNPEHMYDVVAINAASMSTQLAGLPFSGPVGGVRVALIEGQWVAFPDHNQVKEAVFDMVVAGRIAGDDVAIMMVEAEATDNTIELIKGGQTAPTEEVVAEGLDVSKKFIRIMCEAQIALAKVAAKPTAEFPVFLDYQDDVYAAVEGAAKEKLAKALTIAGKQEREEQLNSINAAVTAEIAPSFEGREKEISAAIRSVTKKLVRQRVLRDKVRIDGRGLKDIRPPRWSNSSTRSLQRRRSATCTTTTSRLIRQVRLDESARRSVVRSDMVRSQSVHLSRSFQSVRTSHMRSVRYPRRSAQTVRHRWALSAHPHSRSSMLVCL